MYVYMLSNLLYKEAGNCINAYNLDAKERLRSVSFPVIVLFIDL